MGAWVGVPAIIYVFIVAAVVGSLYSFALLAAQGRVGSVVTTVRVLLRQLAAIGRHLGPEERIESLVKQANREKRLVPFAVMIAVGVLTVMATLYLT